jgi:hypothetical protein
LLEEDEHSELDRCLWLRLLGMLLLFPAAAAAALL